MNFLNVMTQLNEAKRQTTIKFIHGLVDPLEEKIKELEKQLHEATTALGKNNEQWYENGVDHVLVLCNLVKQDGQVGCVISKNKDLRTFIMEYARMFNITKGETP